MSLFEICQWIEVTQGSKGIRESLLLFPIIETTHVLGLAFSAGLIVMIDLRLIGATMKRLPFTEVFKQIEPLSFWGFGVMFISGLLLLYAEPVKLYHSYTFRIKLVFLALTALNALIFKLGIYKTVAVWDADAKFPMKARLAGWASLIFWVGVIGYGRWTAYGLS